MGAVLGLCSAAQVSNMLDFYVRYANGLRHTKLICQYVGKSIFEFHKTKASANYN